jgi:ribosomal protein S18 acetylase RimI-like enzyme
MTIIKCSGKYIDQCVDVHMRSFEGFFLTFLGKNFLELLYKSIIEDPSGIGFVYLTSNEVAGFVFGSTQPTGFYKRILKKKFLQFGFAALGAIIRKPIILFRLLRVFSLANQEINQPGRGTLMSIAVDPDHQGKSIGKELVLSFLKESKKKGCQSIDLTTDAVENDSVNDFYKRMGFSLNRTFTTPENRKMNEYLMDLE